MKVVLLILLCCTLLSCATSPKIGSVQWCDNTASELKENHSLSSALEYAKHCLF